MFSLLTCCSVVLTCANGGNCSKCDEGSAVSTSASVSSSESDTSHSELTILEETTGYEGSFNKVRVNYNDFF